jgi:hypothetical protein
MAALGHTTLAEDERYTREADRRRGGKRAVASLNEHRKNKSSQTTLKVWENRQEVKEKQRHD